MHPQHLWSTVAPPVAWWWLVLAGAAALILGFGFLRAVQLFARPLGILLLGIAIAASLDPFVKTLARWLPRTLAAVLIYLVLLLIAVTVGWIVLPALIDQFVQFSERIPGYFDQAQAWLNHWGPPDGNPFSSAVTSVVSDIGMLLIALPLTIGESLLQVLLILFISFYALTMAQGVRAFILSLVPPRQRGQAQQLLGNMSRAMGGYVRGVVISASIVGISVYAGLLILGVEYPLLLALVAAMFEALPIIGSVISTVIIVAVALLQSPNQALLALLFMLVLQQVQGNIIFPNVMSRQTHVSPLLGILAFFAGGIVGGLLGALVAIPLAAALRVVVTEGLAPMVRHWTGARPALPPE